MLAPASVNECAELTYLAFDLAEKYRNVVEILTDGAISQMIEKCTLPPAKEHDIDKFDWTLTGKPLGVKKNKMNNLTNIIGHPAYSEMMLNKFKTMFSEEQRWESVMTDDAELMLVAYGISSRVCKTAVREARAAGIKLGLIRPITVWPFPRKAFENLPESVKGFVTVEMSISSQMGEDIMMAAKNSKPLYGCLTNVNIPKAKEIVDFCLDVLAGKVEPMEVI